MPRERRERLGPPLPRFDVTVLRSDGGEHSFDLAAVDVERAALLVARKVCLRGFGEVQRQSGAPREAGWFVPWAKGRGGMAGPSFKVEVAEVEP